MKDLEGLDLFQTIEVGAGCVEHKEPIDLEVQLLVLKEFSHCLAQRLSDLIGAMVPWYHLQEYAIAREVLDREIGFLENLKK